MSAAGSWDRHKRRWVKMLNGDRHRISCEQLGLPRHLWTKEGSERAAREYFQRIESQRVIERYSTHPELKPLASAADTLEGEGKDSTQLQEHLKEVAQRPSGATRDDTSLEHAYRKRLEEVLDVDLSHVPQLLLTKLMEQQDYGTKIKHRDDMDTDRTLSHLIDVYMKQRRVSEEKKLKASTTIEFDRYNLRRFNEFFGSGFTVDKITFENWHRWGEHCQSYGDGAWSNKTARTTLIGSRTLLQWLLKTERISRLPSNFDDYKISKEVQEPEIFTDDELRLIFQKADDELKLFVLLALNTGANQVDIAQLTYAKRDKDLGLFGTQIRRKRVKTRRQERVPVVRYILWERTMKLLQEFKTDGEYVFRTPEGNLLVDRHRGPDGKLKNNDCLGLRFRRFAEKISLPDGKTFKTLRATAASKLGNNKQYRVFGPLFLGQAPNGVFEEAYLQEDCRELNEGIAWLETALPLGDY